MKNELRSKINYKEKSVQNFLEKKEDNKWFSTAGKFIVKAPISTDPISVLERIKFEPYDMTKESDILLQHFTEEELQILHDIPY